MFCFNFNTFYFCAHADQWFCFLLSFGVFFLGSRLLRRIILNLAWFALLAFNIFYYTTFCYFSVYFIYRRNINGAEMVLVGNVNANHSIINDTLAMKLYSNIKIFSFMVCSFQFIDFVWVFYSLLGFFSDSKMKRKKNRFIIDTEVFFHNFPTLCELFHLCNRFGQMPISFAPIPNDMFKPIFTDFHRIVKVKKKCTHLIFRWWFFISYFVFDPMRWIITFDKFWIEIVHIVKSSNCFMCLYHFINVLIIQRINFT